MTIREQLQLLIESLPGDDVLVDDAEVLPEEAVEPRAEEEGPNSGDGDQPADVTAAEDTHDMTVLTPGGADALGMENRLAEMYAANEEMRRVIDELVVRIGTIETYFTALNTDMVATPVDTGDIESMADLLNKI